MNCSFKNVYFRKCVANESTRFENCLFEGSLNFEGKEKGWTQVQIDDRCNLKLPAALVWEGLLDKDFGKASDRIMHIMRYALAKFWYHGTSKRSISLINWNTGPIKQTGQSKAILDAMIKAGLISKIKISGVQEGGLSFDRDSRADLKNFMDNSQLSGKIEKLYRLLLAD